MVVEPVQGKARPQRRLHQNVLKTSPEGGAPDSPPLLHRGRWRRSHVGDLHALASAVASSNSGVVICSIFNRGYREMAANWMYSLSRFGGVKEALLVAFDEESLVECLALDFTCFDGALLFPKDVLPYQPETYYPGDQEWYRVSASLLSLILHIRAPDHSAHTVGVDTAKSDSSSDQPELHSDIQVRYL